MNGVPLQPVLAELGIVQRDLARGTGLSVTAVSRLAANGQWPARRASEARASVVAYLKKRGAGIAHLRDLVLPPRKEVGPAEL